MGDIHLIRLDYEGLISNLDVSAANHGGGMYPGVVRPAKPPKYDKGEENKRPYSRNLVDIMHISSDTQSHVAIGHLDIETGAKIDLSTKPEMCI